MKHDRYKNVITKATEIL